MIATSLRAGRRPRSSCRRSPSTRPSPRPGSRPAPWPGCSGPVDETPLAQGRGDQLDRADQARRPVGDDQQRAGQAPRPPGRPGSRPRRRRTRSAPGARPTNTGLPSVVMPQAASTGSAGEPGASEVASRPGTGSPASTLARRRGAQASNSSLIAWQMPAHRRLRHRGLGAEGLGQCRLHVADRQAAHEPGDDQRLQRVRAVTCPRRTGGRRTPRSVPRSFGRVEGDRPGRGLDRQSR